MLKRFTFLHLLICSSLMAQTNPAATMLQLHPVFLGNTFELNDSLQLSKNKITIDNCKFYISHLTFLSKGKEIWLEENSFHLVDISNPKSLKIPLKTPNKIQFDEIYFQLGIDSISNVSGAFGGDLDPTKGMYWAWQSGYINFKLEGNCGTCPTRNHFYEFHLGGYLPPYQSIQTVRLKTNSASNVHIGMDLGKFLEKIDLSKQCAIMSPGIEAQKLSISAASIFYALPHE